MAREKINGWLSFLTSEQRYILIQHLVDGESLTQLAEWDNVSVAAKSKCLKRAIQKCLDKGLTINDNRGSRAELRSFFPGVDQKTYLGKLKSLNDTG